MYFGWIITPVSPSVYATAISSNSFLGTWVMSTRSDPTAIADVTPSMISDHKQHVIEKRFL
jgi:hypothetical protein